LKRNPGSNMFRTNVLLLTSTNAQHGLQPQVTQAHPAHERHKGKNFLAEENESKTKQRFWIRGAIGASNTSSGQLHA
jgi:hypothetical protein